MPATIHDLPVISPEQLLADICEIIRPGLSASLSWTEHVSEGHAAILKASRSRFRKCCAGLTVCTCRIGHRCRCEGCNCS